MKKGYAESVMTVSVEQFSKLAFKLPDTIADGSDFEQASCLLLAPFCFILYINGARYHPGDNSTDLIRRSHFKIE